ncbi:MAG TPA: TIGR03435 family protein [Acidobacteriaceae bacterium]|nr:TIGR03435 family protein [Acidobacteriaceae bacterium]
MSKTSALLLRYFATSLTIAIVFSPTAASAQSQLSQPPTFDVASIRPMSYADDARTHIYNSPRTSEFKAINVTLRALLEVAYELPETQMLGGPAWTSTQKFDLEAKSGPSFDQHLASLSSDEAKEIKRQMLRTLLADRFHLTAHTETRERPIFALVVAKGGAKLTKSTDTGTTLTGGRGRINIKGADDSLAILAFELSWRLGRPVIDQTGLAGRYEVSLNWADDDAAQTASDASAAPSLFTAIQEQLGLKLQSTKGPVPVLLIDHAEKPSAN